MLSKNWGTLGKLVRFWLKKGSLAYFTLTHLLLVIYSFLSLKNNAHRCHQHQEQHSWHPGLSHPNYYGHLYLFSSPTPLLYSVQLLATKYISWIKYWVVVCGIKCKLSWNLPLAHLTRFRNCKSWYQVAIRAGVRPIRLILPCYYPLPLPTL